jgi:predicted nucleic acid-binding protein
MTVTDTGVFVAFLDSSQKDHTLCVTAMKRLPPGPMVTTWACFTEAMYLLGKSGGHAYQEALWALRKAGLLVIHETSPAEADRMQELMAQYQDAPMDLADASIVTAAEVLGQKRIFTLDSHFYAYQTNTGEHFEVTPQATKRTSR